MAGDTTDIRRVSIDAIEVASRLRAIDFQVIIRLAESMTEIGLMNPITVMVTPTGYRLVAGRHRLETARRLDWKTIPALVLDGIDAIDAELHEIDENLCRAELSAAERAAHHARRKALYEQKHPQTKHGGDRKSKKSSAKLAT
jgi:ParB family transcriptional regulator, chromosome partitioning protein